jgi:hypothetical protein
MVSFELIAYGNSDSMIVVERALNSPISRVIDVDFVGII